jgi:hypothetical protein
MSKYELTFNFDCITRMKHFNSAKDRQDFLDCFERENKKLHELEHDAWQKQWGKMNNLVCSGNGDVWINWKYWNYKDYGLKLTAKEKAGYKKKVYGKGV